MKPGPRPVPMVDRSPPAENGTDDNADTEGRMRGNDWLAYTQPLPAPFATPD
jgi:hypothetical protein